MHRRTFIRNVAWGALGFYFYPLLRVRGLGRTRALLKDVPHFPYQLPILEYNFAQFRAFEVLGNWEEHYYSIHADYVERLNKWIEQNKKLQSLNIEQILKNQNLINTLNEDSIELRNIAGGYYNHYLFWNTITPFPSSVPSRWKKIIASHFQSWDLFEQLFFHQAQNWMGSGWIWLVKQTSGSLQIICTPNEDNPLMFFPYPSAIPLLGIDLWEHAYYPSFFENRNEYLRTTWRHINWQKVLHKYEMFCLL